MAESADPGPGEENWGYASDFRAYTRHAAGKWPFLVRASDDVQDITIRWEGKRSLLRQFILRNEQTGEKIRVRPNRSYTFSNSGGANLFTIGIPRDDDSSDDDDSEDGDD